ncbi:F1F0 ATP synthase subunit gamma KNAG_0J01000 [Huiozyma naganishii CBS 8797]|uniref:ATP synthase subunit gamma n=1 Tax=Huiozyma naganishii (strain ATCC MYA-139 / BCRC 22969 / CBS 8797 / KCTC 17520 / NBRC 10181 / NCYC 3082 / Yp74L-3) TaxID=1071383 RepID=J7S2Q5_HUIN7|nr:hypothetical protein KNAG_0J01000 [Kazachstania naganishii CBS 8797]CCK72182.1 hypothetical protein KNAG_0J01000 [Kazachstania naganishii CBS 8797]
MFSRAVANVVRARGATALMSRSAACRNYATLKEVEMRLKSIKNIEKITKTMKIVASTRLSKAEKAKANAIKIDEANEKFFKNAETEKAVVEQEGGEANKELLIAITSDKGLCGAIHSSLARRVRYHLIDSPNCDIISIGDKMKLQLMRSHPDNLKLAINGVGKDAPSFLESALISERIAKEFDLESYGKITIYYNDPISSISFEPSVKPLYSAKTIVNSPFYNKFEIDLDEDVPSDLFEYNLANQILTAMAKGYAAEISARRNAMDNASKNAGDMITKYSILYNRTRQAVITNELVDIITGASTLG